VRSATRSEATVLQPVSDAHATEVDLVRLSTAGAVMERERLDDHEAFTHLRSGLILGTKAGRRAREVVAGRPLPRGRPRPAQR
jgi:hypothetical protein